MALTYKYFLFPSGTFFLGDAGVSVVPTFVNSVVGGHDASLCKP